jgi:hypothetical protein
MVNAEYYLLRGDEISNRRYNECWMISRIEEIPTSISSYKRLHKSNLPILSFTLDLLFGTTITPRRRWMVQSPLPYIISRLPPYRKEGVMREFEPEYIMGELEPIFTLVYISIACSFVLNLPPRFIPY